MTRITIYNVKRAITPKAGNSELWFLCSTHHIMVIYICIKFQENISKSFQVTEWTHIYYRNQYFQCSKSHITKSRLTRNMVMCSAHPIIVLYICEKFHEISQTVFYLQSRHKHMVKMAIFNVQRAITPKVGKPVMVHEFCTSSHGALNFCEVSSKCLKRIPTYRVDNSIW